MASFVSTKVVRTMLPGRSKYDSAPSTRFCRPYRNALCNALWSFVVTRSIFPSLAGMRMLYIRPPMSMSVKENESCRPSANLMPPYLLFFFFFFVLVFVVILWTGKRKCVCGFLYQLISELSSVHLSLYWDHFGADSLQTLRAVSSGSSLCITAQKDSSHGWQSSQLS